MFPSTIHATPAREYWTVLETPCYIPVANTTIAAKV